MTVSRVHVVVVAYHGADLLDHCLAALERSVDVTVVDNSSSTEIRAVADRHHAAHVDPGANLGFAAGVNAALRTLLTGPPRDVLLVNPDANVRPDTIAALANHLHTPGNERVAAVAPRLLSQDGSAQRVAWPYPSPGRACFEAIGLGRLPSRRHFVVGAVLMLRWEALEEVGLFDERFFLYAEETDWQRRAADLGWSSTVCPETIALHWGAGASEDPLRREAFFHAGQETYIRKWYGELGWCLYRAASCLGASVRAIVLSDERRSEAARRARLYARGPRRCASIARD